MSSLLIKGGHVVDPQTRFDGRADVLIVDGEIKELQIEERQMEEIQIEGLQINGLQIEELRSGQPEEGVDEVIDASGCYVMPGIIDLHVHLRDPGLTYKETLQTAGMAAARGGVTTICAMPNTKPVTDTKEMVEDLHRRAKEESPIHVIQLGAVTKGQQGEELADIKGMAEAGCHAISEDGKSVMNASLYRKGMKMAEASGISIFAHCEDITLVEGGVMNAGERAKELGVKGITNSVEDTIAARDIVLAKETGVRLHLCHCSTADSVEMVKAAKAEKLPVTGEVCPHHFILTDEDITENHGRFKMNPPLRSRVDVEALRKGLREDIMDVISTDHAPHTKEEKDCPMEKAAFGIVGLETSACLTYTELVDTGVIHRMQMAEKMSYNPARILGLEKKGAVARGWIADLMIYDPRPEYRIDADTFYSKGRNTPFDAYPVKGEVVCTIVGGEIVYCKGKGVRLPSGEWVNQ